MADRVQQVIRQHLKQIRANISPAYHIRASQRVCQQIKQQTIYRHARKIALYHAINHEISLESLWQSAPFQGKLCYFPILNQSGGLSFLPATPYTPTVLNRFGIPEPDVPLSKAIAPNDLDIIFVPLVGFDRFGNRLGMGAGYYDAVLTNLHHPRFIGVGYQFQRLEKINTHSKDVPLHAIITERQIYDIP